jgi:hypothetical protein
MIVSKIQSGENMKHYLLLSVILITSCIAQVPSRQEQINAALQAAPAQFRDNATVLGYDSDGKLVTLKKGTNHMICLADDPAQSGFSAAAYHKDLEPFMARGRELRAEGKSREEVFNIREQEAKSGKLPMPDKGGATLHILFGKDATYNSDTGKVENAIYRYVVYIPWATTESTGLPTTPSANGGPWIMDAGTHKAHIMINPPVQN